jgi:hypothetical protein
MFLGFMVGLCVGIGVTLLLLLVVPVQRLPLSLLEELAEMTVRYTRERGGYVRCDDCEKPITKQEWARLNPKYAHTWDWDEHPQGYEDICACAECRSCD